MILLWLVAALLHPVHETVAEAQWNDESKSLEVAVRLDLQDDQWLEKRYRRDREDRDWRLRYARERFRMAPRPQDDQPDSCRYRWVGRQDEGAHVWWYFEIRPDHRQRPQWIEQRFLFDRERNFANRVLILGSTEKQAITLTIQQPRAKIK